ncbi:MAG: hypothetical protein M1348_02765 [Candidatus Parvarchaeota archaeon]|jgi:hypothetical protein|nr:hypothetical protein [Candidatus Parvarchaeota archaeon]MCL5101506.1 hypothetical protein [Candidatus Parvarchaeota archaeon]
MATKTLLSEQEKKQVDTVLALVLYGVGTVLLVLGFSSWLAALLPLLQGYGAEIIVGAIALVLSVSVFKVRI